MLRFRVTNAEGKRVENTLPIGLVREFPKDRDAWREVDRLGLGVRINDSSYARSALHLIFLRSITSRPISVRMLYARNR